MRCEDKIVDRLGYWDQVQDFFKTAHQGWNPISLNRYRASLKDDGIAGQKIAVVHATGLIVSGRVANYAGRRIRDGR